MVEISHVRLAVPELGPLGHIFREGGAQLFPQWLSTDYAAEPRIVWWGMRGVLLETLDPPDNEARRGLWPRTFEDWTEPPRGLVLATVDADRAVADLAPVLDVDTGWWDVGRDDALSATCRRITLGRSVLVLAEAAGEGYVAACLARFGEGPIAVAVDGTSAAGRDMTSNPITDGPATYVRLGPGTAPTLIFLPAAA